MFRTKILLGIVFILTIAVFGSAQTDPLKPSVLTGDVTSVTDAKIVLNSKTGPIDVVLNSKTEFKRVPPENPTVKAAVDSSVSEIGVGDKLMVTGILAADGKSVPARAVYVMSQSELSKKKAKDAEMWRTRGISGKVASVNAQSDQIVVEMGGMTKTMVTLTPKANASFIRYASDSVKFSDAKPSSLTEIKTGDEIRAIGDKNIEGTAFAAETVLTGGFRQSAGTVKSVDAANKQVVIEDLGTKKELTISFADAVLMKRFPEEMAGRMAAMQMGGGMTPGAGGVQVIRPPGGGQPAGGTTPANGGQPGEGGPRPVGGGRAGSGLSEMIDKLPNMTAEELKVGETIAILTSSSTAGADHVKAIKLVAGVDPFIKMAQMAQAGRVAGGRGGNGVNFNIPGLDGVSFP